MRIHKEQSGFTLMEIVVATTIFAVVVAALMSMFNYTLKINRRGEALRQASQSMRDLVEFITKEVRNGAIDYRTPGTATGSAPGALGPCGSGGMPAITQPGGAGNPITSIGDTYNSQDNKFAVQTSEGDIECFYLAYGPGFNVVGKSVGDYVGSGVFAAETSTAPARNPKPALAMQKSNVAGSVEMLTAPNVSIQRLMFFVRPTCDPNWGLCSSYGNSYPKMQPFVTIVAQFRVNLPTGEQTDIYYQTTVSSNKYDIPTH
jgi:prepilin-type N-terminal cleavage/methylation domain-containing protein